jgi:uncharacterized Zn-finger protein
MEKPNTKQCLSQGISSSGEEQKSFKNNIIDMQLPNLMQVDRAAFLQEYALDSRFLNIYENNKVEEEQNLEELKDKIIQSHQRGKKTKKDTPVTCGLCLNTYKNIYQLKIHFRSHLNIRNYKCKYEGCEKSYKHSSNLDSHVKIIHLGLKPHVCRFCKKEFKQKHSKLINIKIK